MWVTGVIYKHGFTGIWYTFFSAWCAISAFVSTRIFRRSLAYTQAEWQGLRFGGLGSELLRGWMAGWQVFMNMFILGWVGMAMGKVCNFAFGWPIWIGLMVFSAVCAVYVLSAGYWGVVMADFQQGIVALAAILIVSVWCIVAAGGPAKIISKLKQYNSTCTWEIDKNINRSVESYIRLMDSRSGSLYSMTKDPFYITTETNPDRVQRMNDRSTTLIEQLRLSPNEEVKLLFPTSVDTLDAGQSYNIVWIAGSNGKHVDVEYSIDNGKSWRGIAESHYDGQSWRINPFKFTGLFKGQFPFAWFITMLVIALIGGFGMGTSIDWYSEAQRIQSAKTVRDASYSVWWGTAMVIIRNSIWAVAILGFFVLMPNIPKASEYELGWFRMAFSTLPVGMLGFFFASILAIHLSTISTHLNLGAVYATRDIYHHYINPDASQKKLIWVGRFSTLLLLLGSFIFGLMMKEITKWLIFALWIMAAGVWLPNILQVIWWRFNAWGYLTSWIANLGLSWLVVWVLPMFGVIPQLPDYLQFWVLMVLTAFIYLPVTYLTKPEKMDHLVKYYVMSRPIGFWGPVRREAEKQGLLDRITHIQ
jgi:Na+/proline symporter